MSCGLVVPDLFHKKVFNDPKYFEIHETGFNVHTFCEPREVLNLMLRSSDCKSSKSSDFRTLQSTQPFSSTHTSQVGASGGGLSVQCVLFRKSSENLSSSFLSTILHTQLGRSTTFFGIKLL